jgi:dUTP pyrophosphatase
MVLKVKRLKGDAVLPHYAHPGDVGLDLYSVDAGVVVPGERKLFFCGFALEFSNGYAAIVKDRGSMARKGLHALGGVFDAGFRGEYNVMLYNVADTPYEVRKGDKIAQLVIVPVEIADVQEVEGLSESSRGLGQFGSTGANVDNPL